MVQKVVEAARRIRQEAGLDEPPFSTRTIVDCCFPHVLVLGATLPRRVAEFMSMGGAGPVIIYNRKRPTPDQRFSVAHGLGHVIFDLAEVQAPCPKATGDRRDRDERENRAEAFAAELLVPLDWLEKYVMEAEFPRSPVGRQAHLDMVDDLATQFQVPQAVIRGRVRELARRRKEARGK